MDRVKFAQRVFFWSGVYGLLVLVPQYVLERQLAEQSQPVSHPEFYYGFTGLGVAWQLAFLVISRDVRRFRPLMLPSVVEKFSFVASTYPLYFAGRTPGTILVFATIDLLLGVLFLVCYFQLSEMPSPEASGGARV